MQILKMMNAWSMEILSVRCGVIAALTNQCVSQLLSGFCTNHGTAVYGTSSWSCMIIPVIVQWLVEAAAQVWSCFWNFLVTN